MIQKDILRKIIQLQKGELESKDIGVKRDIFGNIDLRIPFAAIISGIRRSGKSTLLKQLVHNTNNFYYFNFEDSRAINFEISDFKKLDEAFHEEFGNSEHYFFDEIQNINGWERFVRMMLDSGKKFVITGSNASLLSKELGTKLTGRHITYELFPFSYHEMLKLTLQKPSLLSFQDYFNNGGFPEFLRYHKNEILQELLNDIIARDIIARYNLRETKIIKEMAVYLLTNTGKEFSYNNLAKNFNLGSANTAISYISYYENSYLMFTIPKFDYSYKKQMINPKKIYSIDVGLSSINSASFFEEKGRILENLAFINLRRKHKEIYYFREKKECDFLVRDKGKIIKAIQVCYDLNEENMDKEISGLKEAMDKLKIKDGAIITFDQEDQLDGIKIKPMWKWLLEK